MNILYVVSGLKKTGLTNIIFNTIKHINLKEHTVHVVTIKYNDSNSYKDELVSVGVKVFSLNSNAFNVASNYLGISKYCKLNNIQIVHAHCLSSIICCSFLPRCFKKICTSHSFIPYNYSGEFGKYKGFFLSRLIISRMKKFDQIVAVSDSVCQLYKKIENITTYTIRNGVEISDNRKNIHNEYQDFDFIFVGSISYRKQVELLCKSFSKFNIGNRFKLCIVGDGPLYSYLAEKFMSDCIVFVGHQVDVKCYLLKSKFFISPSLSEGLPNSVLEAFSLGIPCLLSNIPPHAELTKDIKLLNDLLFDIEEDSIVKALDKAIILKPHEIEKILDLEVALIEDELNTITMSERHLDLYNKVYFS